MSRHDASRSVAGASRIEVLIRDLERCSDPAALAAARAMAGTILEPRGDGLARVLEPGAEKTAPFVRSRGATVELLEAAHGTVRLRLSGAGRLCPSTVRALRGAIERALDEAAPDVSRITIEGVPAPPVGSLFRPLLNGFSPS